MTQRIREAIDIFLDAINNGTLAKGTCAACAVGNLIAATGEFQAKVHRNEYLKNCDTLKFGYDHWLIAIRNERDQFCIGSQLNVQRIDNGMRQMTKTKFTIEELNEIELAFERETRIMYSAYPKFLPDEIRQDQINGLKAVVEVMMTFDDVMEDVDEVFTKKAELIPIA